MTQFRERNPIPIAIVGIVVILGLILLAFSATNIAFLGGGGTTYHADFQEASNIQTGDDVRIAGIKVGTVTSVTIAGDHVRVAMKLQPGTQVFDQTRADLKIKTLLGAMYVDLTPNGTSKLSPRIDIPLARTTTPLIVTAAFQKVSGAISSIDVTQLAAAFNTLSSDFAGTPSEVGPTLRGLAALSQTISSRDQALQTLLAHSANVTGALATRDSQITQLINDGQTVLNLVTQQRDVIHALLVDTSTLSQQISALVRENTAQLSPALRNLGAAVGILTKDQAQLDGGIHLLAPFVRDFTNTIGNGQYFDSQVANLTDLGKPGCFTFALKQPGQAPQLLLPAPAGSNGPAAGCK